MTAPKENASLAGRLAALARPLVGLAAPAVKLSAGYTDDLMKSLAEDMQKDAEAETTEAALVKVEEKKPAKKAEQKKSE